MCQALFCVTLIARASSQLLMPFFALLMHQTATNHLSKPSGESSKIVPTLTENCYRQDLALHWYMRRLAMKPMLSQPQRGHFTSPVGHFNFAM